MPIERERLVFLFTLLKCGVSLYSGGVLDAGKRKECGPQIRNTKNWLFMCVCPAAAAAAAAEASLNYFCIVPAQNECLN